jgi:hypothetical protein
MIPPRIRMSLIVSIAGFHTPQDGTLAIYIDDNLAARLDQ